MTRLRTLLLFLVILTLGTAPGWAQAAKAPGFEKLKSLVGEWEGKNANGQTVRVSYRLVSGGSVLMETLQPAGEPEMVTLYHPDGDSLMVTHYCSANNQPRMRATPAGGEVKELNFEFVDATNLPDPSAGHMHHLALTFEDANHVTQIWTWQQAGQQKAEAFHFTRRTLRGSK